MNSEHLERLIITVLEPFTTAVMETKEDLVSSCGTGSELLPTFGAFRTENGASVLGSCAVLENRITGVKTGTTRWMNLCRQVVNLTQADAALVAVEVMTEDPPLETLEVSLLTPESVTTTLRPYRYELGRKVQWLGQSVPDNGNWYRGGMVEMEAAQQAWDSGDKVAYPASVRYLSELCGCTWTGDPDMLRALQN